jgi:hypothetical protein
MASLEKSRNSLQTGVGVEPLFMLRCDRSPVMLTWFRKRSRSDHPRNPVALLSLIGYMSCSTTIQTLYFEPELSPAR